MKTINGLSVLPVDGACKKKTYFLWRPAVNPQSKTYVTTAITIFLHVNPMPLPRSITTAYQEYINQVN